MSRLVLNIEKRSLPRPMLSGAGLASKDAVWVFVRVRFQSRRNAPISRVVEMPATALAGTPVDFCKLIADETEKRAKVIRAANIKPE